MMMRRWQVQDRLSSWAVLLAAGVALAGSGCDRKPEAASPKASTAGSKMTQPSTAPYVSDQDLVARVNGAAISTTDVEVATQELKRLVQAYQQKWETLPAEAIEGKLDLTDVVESLRDSELKAQDAKTRGLDTKTDTRRRFAYLQRSFFAQEWDRWQRERAKPTEEQVHAFYEQNKAGFIEPERIRVRQIVTESQGEAESVRTKAVAGADFTQLARDFSTGAGREEGGDIGWHVREVFMRILTTMGRAQGEKTFFEQLEPVAFALETGQVSMPVKGPDNKYYIVKLEERIPQKQRAELEVRDDITEMLTLQKIQETMKELRDKATTQTFPERLTNVKQ